MAPGTREFSDIRGFSLHYPRFRTDSSQPVAQPTIIRADGRIEKLVPGWFGTTRTARRISEALESFRVSVAARQPVFPLPHAVESPTTLPLPFAAPEPGAKICTICGQDCSDAPRYRDDAGNYMHQACRDRG